MPDPRIETLKASNVRGTFAASLILQYEDRGSLSDKQWYWVEKLAADAAAPEPGPVAVGTFTGVFQLIERAAEHLRFPKIRLGFGGPSGIANDLVLKIAGPRSRYHGDILVTDGRPFGENKFYGVITEDGEYAPGRDARSDSDVAEALVAKLTSLADDPQAVASEYGRLTGNCCFCSRPLEDDRSTDVGYGPVCAKNYGLNWG